MCGGGNVITIYIRWKGNNCGKQWCKYLSTKSKLDADLWAYNIRTLSGHYLDVKCRSR